MVAEIDWAFTYLRSTEVGRSQGEVRSGSGSSKEGPGTSVVTWYIHGDD